MTKLTRVIVFLFVLTFLLSYPIRNVYSDWQIDNNYIPSITFGDLLRNTNSNQSSVVGNQSVTTSRQTAIKDLLARLDESSVQSKEQFSPSTKLRASNLAMEQFVESVSELVVTPQPTYHPRLESILAEEAIRSVISNQNSVVSDQLPTNDNRQLITDNLLPITVNTGELVENPIRTTYVIAILGDSMVDTLGKDLNFLREKLGVEYPNYSFALLNYGQGSTDLESGLYRLTNTTVYLGRYFAPLLSYQPDILVVESFAYNHWSSEKYDLDRQWLTIAKIIDKVREISPNTKIVLAATIAPNAKIFGDGALNWPADLKWQSAQITKAYLQNLINFATSQNYPLSDAYSPTLGSDGNGLPQYINGGDHLHPSNEGAALFSEKIVETIVNNSLIK